jgi:hypothetical protein
MNPEKARELRDGHSRPRPRPFLPQPDTYKTRQLRFDARHPGEVGRAVNLLSGLPGMLVAPGETALSLSISYDLGEYTLEGLEAGLVAQEFHLDNSIIRRIQRALTHFSEETQLRNMRVPERLIKKSQQIYSKAWDKHLHGDHDNTPPDLRQDR